MDKIRVIVVDIDREIIEVFTTLKAAALCVGLSISYLHVLTKGRSCTKYKGYIIGRDIYINKCLKGYAISR